MSLNLPSIDADHQELVRIVNVLEKGVLEGDQPRILGGILGRLAEYAGHHFNREEQIMRHFGYPGLIQHTEQHEVLLNRLAQIVYEFEIGVSTVTLHTTDLVRDWFEQHLVQEDAAFGVFLRFRFGPGNHEPPLNEWLPSRAAI